MDAIVKTDFCFPGQKSVYKGKVTVYLAFWGLSIYAMPGTEVL